MWAFPVAKNKNIRVVMKCWHISLYDTSSFFDKKSKNLREGRMKAVGELIVSEGEEKTFISNTA